MSFGYIIGCSESPTSLSGPVDSLADALALDAPPPALHTVLATDTDDGGLSVEASDPPDASSSPDARAADAAPHDALQDSDARPGGSARKELFVIIDDFGIDGALPWADNDGAGQAEDGRNHAVRAFKHRARRLLAESRCSLTYGALLKALDDTGRVPSGLN